VRLFEKLYHIPNIPGISFFYQHSFSVGFNGMLSRVFWDVPSYWMLKISMTQKIILLSMSAVILSWCFM